jgi:hypothetical protein
MQEVIFKYLGLKISYKGSYIKLLKCMWTSDLMCLILLKSDPTQYLCQLANVFL